MPREGKSSITLNTATFEMLRCNKPEGVTWDRYLTDLQYNMDKEA